MATLIVVEDMAHPATVGRGGMALYVLQVLEGLRRLGHEVLFVEFLDEHPGPEAISYFEAVIDGWWARSRAALLLAPELESLGGVPAASVAATAARADGVITLAAHYRPEPWPLLEAVRPRVVIDGDPAYTHLWAAAEDDPAEVYGPQDVHFTVGLNIGSERCAVPTLGLDWTPTVYPIVLDWWPADRAIARDRFTTVGSWRDYGYLEFDGRTLGPKVDEFERFLALPELAGEALELALQIDPDDEDLPLLREHGWRVEDAAIVADPGRFVDYVAGSAGEFTCAKGGYVGTRSGWFGDRSAGYLAAGRPVVLQATGFEDVFPTGEGLFAVSTPEEAAEAIRAIRADYGRHSRAARALAVERFDSARVLRRVLDAAGIT